MKHRIAEETNVRIERLELETPSETVEMTLHPLLTVVTGLGRLEREALSGEILGALGAGRPGLSVDLVGPDGKFIKVDRPLDGPPTVTDAIDGTDLTAHYSRGSVVDLLGSIGLDKGQARTLLRMGRTDVRPPEEKWHLIERLSKLDQDELWGTATAIASAAVELEQLGAEMAGQRGPIDEIEHRHAAVEVAADALEELHRDTILAAAGCAVAGLLMAVIVSPYMALPFFLGAAVAAGLAGWRWKELRESQAAERQALLKNNLSTYLEYQMVQVEELTDNTTRSRRLELMDARTAATACWNTLTGGGISLAWAVDHRPEILRLSEQAPADDSGPTAVPDLLPRLDDAHLGAFDALKQRIGQLSVLFPAGMMLLLDDPLSDLDEFELTAALTLIDDALEQHQLVLMSDDPRIVGWARQLAKETRALVLDLGGNQEPSVPASNAPTPAPTLIDA